MYHRWQVLLIAMLAVACTKSTESPSHSFHTYVEDGVTIAETTGEPKYEGEIFNYEPILTLQGNESNPESLLHFPRLGNLPTSFTIDSKGYFYIADTRNHRIAVFRPDGSYERSFGQEGNGPGDLMNPRQIVEKDGILHIQGSNNRTTHYATDGSLIDIVQDFRGGNSIWGYGEYFVDIQSPSNPPDFTTLRYEALVKNTGGDTIAVISTPEVTISVPVPTIARINNSRRLRPINLQYSGWPRILHLQTQEILFYAGSDPELIFYDISGKIIRRVLVDIPPEPISVDDRRIVESRLSELMELAVTNPSEFPIKMNPSDIPFADTKAPWHAIEVDDFGYIWLQESLPTFPFSPIGIEPIEYKLLSPEGEYLGNTHRPIAMTGQVAHGYLLALVSDEETGTIVPTVYQISSTINGFDYP